MKRIPIVSTVIVLLCVIAMIALGIWQLHRRDWKEGLLAHYAANIHQPAIAWPRFPNDDVLFREASGFCLEPVSFDVEGAGAAGFRVIASCRTGAEGPGMRVQLGTSHDPQVKSDWKGGKVSGFISHAPSHEVLIQQIFDKARPEMMLVADTPPPGLAANPGPDLSAIPNNHMAYAVQWFIFASLALLIYGIALYRRVKAPPAA